MVKNKIMIGIPTASGLIHAQTVSALMAMKRPEGTTISCATVPRQLVDIARNTVVEITLKSNCDYLFFVDDDCAVPNNALEELLALDKDIALGIVVSRTGSNEVWVFDENNELIKEIPTTPFKCGGGSMGCALIKRNVLLKLWDKFQGYAFKFETKNTDKGVEMFGEDLIYCQRARDEGFEVWCHPDISPHHIGSPTAYHYTNNKE